MAKFIKSKFRVLWGTIFSFIAGIFTTDISSQEVDSNVNDENASSETFSSFTLSSTSCEEISVENIPAKKLNIVPHKTLNFDFINLAICITPF